MGIDIFSSGVNQNGSFSNQKRYNYDQYLTPDDDLRAMRREATDMLGGTEMLRDGSGQGYERYRGYRNGQNAPVDYTGNAKARYQQAMDSMDAKLARSAAVTGAQNVPASNPGGLSSANSAAMMAQWRDKMNASQMAGGIGIAAQNAMLEQDNLSSLLNERATMKALEDDARGKQWQYDLMGGAKGVIGGVLGSLGPIGGAASGALDVAYGAGVQNSNPYINTAGNFDLGGVGQGIGQGLNARNEQDVLRQRRAQQQPDINPYGPEASKFGKLSISGNRRQAAYGAVDGLGYSTPAARDVYYDPNSRFTY